MSTAMIANAMTKLRKMTRKRRSISSAGDHGNSYRRKYGAKPVDMGCEGFTAAIYVAARSRSTTAKETLPYSASLHVSMTFFRTL